MIEEFISINLEEDHEMVLANLFYRHLCSTLSN